MSVSIRDMGGDYDYKKDRTFGEGSELYDDEKERTREEWIDYIISEQKWKSRKEQRNDDTSRDHGLRLFARQKKRSTGVICCTLLLLTLVYAGQLLVMYNLFHQAQLVKSSEVAEWMQRSYIIVPANPTAVNFIDTTNAARNLSFFANENRNEFEMDINKFPEFGVCFTNNGAFQDGYITAIANVAGALFIIYLFLLFDLWYFIMETPLTRSFPGTEPRGLLMVAGELWIVLCNSTVVVWLGVISASSILANCLDFLLVLNVAFQLFVILQIDDVVLPAVRYFIEEAGYLDVTTGELLPERLILLTHGKQYYKPGYGARWCTNFRNPNFILRIISFILFIVMIAIIFVPAAILVANASKVIVPCQ